MIEGYVHTSSWLAEFKLKSSKAQFMMKFISEGRKRLVQDRQGARNRISILEATLGKNFYIESIGMRMNLPLRLLVLLVLFALCVLAKEDIGNTVSSGNTTDNVKAHTIKESGHENKTEQPCPGGKDDCGERGYVRIGTGVSPKVRRYAKSPNRGRRMSRRVRRDAESPYRERGMSRRRNKPIDWWQPNARILGQQVDVPYRVRRDAESPYRERGMSRRAYRRRDYDVRRDAESPYRERGMSRRINKPIDLWQPNARILGQQVDVPYRPYRQRDYDVRRDAEPPYRDRRMSRRSNEPIDWWQPNARILGRQVDVPFRAYRQRDYGSSHRFSTLNRPELDLL
nr:unnamed protein product [Haemonchus contortus]